VEGGVKDPFVDMTHKALAKIQLKVILSLKMS
jgi:hypothetical protein